MYRARPPRFSNAILNSFLLIIGALSDVLEIYEIYMYKCISSSSVFIITMLRRSVSIEYSSVQMKCSIVLVRP